MTDTTDAVAATTAPEPTAPVEPNPTTEQQAEPAPPAEPTEDAADSEDHGEGSADESKPKRKGGGFQKRIDELTRTNYEKDFRLQAAEQELAALKKQTATDLSADPGERPKIDQFKTLEEYEAALLDYAKRDGYRTAQQERTEKEQRESAFAAQAAFQTRVNDAKRKYADFAPVVSQVAPILDAHPAIHQYITTSDTGTDLSYHLGKNPAALLELTRMDALSQVRELVKMEMRLAAPPPPKPITNAPPPIKPVGARETVPVTLGDLARSEDASAYIKRANQRKAH